MLGLDIVRQLDNCTRLGLDSLMIYDQLDSTQTALIDASSSTGYSWRAIIAQQQVAGFGRQGRVWQSAFGQVAFSWRGWVSVPSIDDVGLLSLAAALAVSDALRQFGVSNVQFKWPNDVYIQDKKLAGILITTCNKKDNKFDCVLGIGLNRLHDALPEQAIALADIIPQLPSLSSVLAELLIAWHRWKVVLASEYGKNQVSSAWLKQALWINRPVRVLLAHEYHDGVFVGITPSGLLRVITDRGERVFAAGEVQLRSLDW
jgi:BirA family biotin operon repressor/biotin-[acetyl-CoA-carboxylase] ligase